jgi:hypothetical protein
MSGVRRLRAAKKGGGSLSIQHGAQKTDVKGGATDVSDKGFGAPKKQGAWDRYPKTGVPQGNESPKRGEYQNPGNTKPGTQ